jgi:starch phosphorylase
LGFARRFATYKRPNLLLRDTARLLRLLSHADHPVQLIIAGKAHPADEPGQALIRQWLQFIRGTDARNHVIFLADYDMAVAEQLVHGVDVWINTPRRPWEACGTSGMKVLVNGGINLSQLDGWWAEGYRPEVGWAIGDAQTHGDEGAWDDRDAAALFEVLEREVVPQFYTRDAAGIPSAWIARMRESMATLTPQFSSSRAVHDYTQRYYLPAAQEWLRRQGQGQTGQAATLARAARCGLGPVAFRECHHRDHGQRVRIRRADLSGRACAPGPGGTAVRQWYRRRRAAGV